MKCGIFWKHFSPCSQICSQKRKSRIRETHNLSTDADRSTNIHVSVGVKKGSLNSDTFENSHLIIPIISYLFLLHFFLTLHQKQNSHPPSSPILFPNHFFVKCTKHQRKSKNWNKKLNIVFKLYSSFVKKINFFFIY